MTKKQNDASIARQQAHSSTAKYTRSELAKEAAPVAEPKHWGERGKVNFRAQCPNKSFGGCRLCEGHPGECRFDDPPPVGTPTPGPWRVRSKCSPGNPQVEQDSAEHPQICCALGHRPSDYANLRLIAAAPETARQRDELLAACKSAVSFARPYWDEMRNSAALRLVEQLENAIARCQPAEKGSK